MTRPIFLLLLLSIQISGFAVGQDVAQDVVETISQDVQTGTSDASEEPTELESLVVDYVAAFNAGDVEKLLSFWSAGGAYVDESTNDQVSGRDAIGESFRRMFAEHPGIKLSCSTRRFEQPSPNVAIEYGDAVIVRPGSDTSATSYRVVYLKSDGKWLIDSVTDQVASAVAPESPLRQLDWLVGKWIDQSDEGTLRIECDWTKGEAFLCRRYWVESKDSVADSSGMQLISWDAKKKAIRSWLFDSSGTVIDGEWNRRGEQWLVRSVATFADGASGSSTSVFTLQEDGDFLWEKVDRMVDGTLLPNIDESLVRRQ